MFVNQEWVLYLSERSVDNAIGFHIENRLSQEDIERYRSVIKGAIAQFGKVRLLISIDSLSPVEPEEIWEDLKFSVAYKKDIDCLALVGDEEVEAWLSGHPAKMNDPEIRYFFSDQYDEAWDWLKDE